jgi:NosR/NirI family nitrous oxide reductase transcriptional regulator
MTVNKKVYFKPSRHLERLLALAALVFIVFAYFIGLSRAEADLEPFLEQAFPYAGYFEQTQGDIYRAWNNPKKESLLGYVSIGTADGYGGQLKLAVAVSMEGSVLGFSVVEHKETVSFFRRVLRSPLLESLRAKPYSDFFNIGLDVDGVTGATYSSRALTEAVKNASRQVAVKALNLPVIEEPSPRLRFGFAEGVLLGLFLFGLLARKKSFKSKKAARWVSMVLGLGFLGFILNKPFTLVLINKILLGFWPKWQLELYWYILIGGIVLITLIDNKNPYCEWFCPFGATQECIGIIGGVKVRVPNRIHYALRWLQRGIALAAIVLAMIYRNPSVSSYEVFGAFFRLIGTNLLFILLAIVLVAALFIRRPWCSYLCPLRPVTDFIRLLRK